MNSRTQKITSAGLAFALAFALAGCSGTSQTTTSTTTSTTGSTQATSGSIVSDASSLATTASASSGDAVEITGLDVSDMFTDRDLAGTWDTSGVTTVTLSDSGSQADSSGVTVSGNVVTIKAEGTYVFSGSLTNGQIVVDVDDSSKVQIVLNGVTITNDSLAAVYVVNADKVFLTAAEGSTNKLSTSGTVSQDGDESVDGTVFSHDDLCVNGSGSLTVTSAGNHGIVSSDDLKLAGVNLTVEAAGQGLRANNSIRIASGTYTITTTDDAIHADSSDDENGYVYIQDGSFALSSGDDGIHADGNVLICGGTIDIAQSYEGIEGQVIGVAGGTINVVSSDDGFNAATHTEDDTETSTGFDLDSAQGMQQFGAMDSDANCYLVISGGNLSVTAGGDGLDSNGYIRVTGGTTYVWGPENDGNGSIDTGISATISGGTVLAAGSSGMAETFSSDSTQCSALVGLSGSAGDTITVSDSSGNVIVSGTAGASYACVVVSSPDMAQGETYTVSNGSSSVEVEMSSVSVSSGVTGGMGMGAMGGMGEMGTMPQDGGQGGPSGMGGGPQSDSQSGGMGGPGQGAMGATGTTTSTTTSTVSA